MKIIWSWWNKQNAQVKAALIAGVFGLPAIFIASLNYLSERGATKPNLDLIDISVGQIDSTVVIDLLTWNNSNQKTAISSITLSIKSSSDIRNSSLDRTSHITGDLQVVTADEGANTSRANRKVEGKIRSNGITFNFSGTIYFTNNLNHWVLRMNIPIRDEVEEKTNKSILLHLPNSLMLAEGSDKETPTTIDLFQLFTKKEKAIEIAAVVNYANSKKTKKKVIW